MCVSSSSLWKDVFKACTAQRCSWMVGWCHLCRITLRRPASLLFSPHVHQNVYVTLVRVVFPLISMELEKDLQQSHSALARPYHPFSFGAGAGHVYCFLSVLTIVMGISFFQMLFPLSQFQKLKTTREKENKRKKKGLLALSGLFINFPTFHLFPLFYTDLVIVFSPLLMSCDFVAFHTRW